MATPNIEDIYNKVVKEYGIIDRGEIEFVVSTGSYLLDRALVIGGYPGGRIVEIYGAEASGKSTLAMHACVNAQKMGLPFGYIDMETALDLAYFKKLGMQGEPNKDWLCVSPETGEDCFSIIENWIDLGIKVIIIDSVAVMTPRAEFDGEMGEAFMGLQARMMGQGLRKISNRVSKKGVLVIFINQTRQKLGVMFGSDQTTTGGNALKFYTSIRLDIRQVGDPILGDGDEQIGRISKVLVKKNKLAPPMKSCLVPIVWGRGIATEMELLDILLIEGIITKSSSYFTYKSEKFNGKRNTYDFIVDHIDELKQVLENKGKEKL